MAGDSPDPEELGDVADLGMRGGAGTFHGTDYQLRLAVLHALVLIERELCAPHLPLIITIEPIVEGDKGIEKWDFSIEPPAQVFEAKTTPVAAEVRDFLENAARSNAESCVLIYSVGSGTTLRALRKLLRVRAMSGDDESRFGRLLAAEGEDVRTLATHAGSDPYEVVTRVKESNVPEGVLATNIEFLARRLAGESWDQLVSMLVDDFSKGASGRRPHPVVQIIEAAKSRGIHVDEPRDTSTDLSIATRRMLLILDRVGRPVPAIALANAGATTEAQVEGSLEPLIASGLVTRVGETGWELVIPLPGPTRVTDAEPILAQALRGLQDWIATNQSHPELEMAVDVAVVLSELVKDSHPEVTARTFPALDKHLKARGQRKLVLDVAQTSIAAAKVAQRSDEVATAEAIALICGRSWVYQRVGELDRARADGEKSLTIASDLGDKRTIAFCHKCLGRIERMAAQELSGDERVAALEASINHLRESIDRFADLGAEAEVGDAYSLLARTYLVAEDFDTGQECIDEACQRLTDPANKDFHDLHIVRGDYAARAGRPCDARDDYDEVVNTLPVNGHNNEIRARALHQRASLLNSTPESVIADLEEAADIFDTLREPKRAADSRLQAMKLQGRVPTRDTNPEIARILEDEVPLVQVLAVQAHEREISNDRYREDALALRERPTVRHWREHVRQARHDVAREGSFW